MTTEEKINIILETLDEIITIPSYQEDKVKEKLRKALRIIEESNDNDTTG